MRIGSSPYDLRPALSKKQRGPICLPVYAGALRMRRKRSLIRDSEPCEVPADV